MQRNIKKAKKFGKKGTTRTLSESEIRARINLRAAKRLGDFSMVRKIEHALRVNY